MDFSVPHRPFSIGLTATQDVDDLLARIPELESAAEQTYRVLQLAESVYLLATRDSNYDDLDVDPHVVATRAARDAAQVAYSRAAERLEEVLALEPRVLTREGTTPQCRRALQRWADNRGGAEELTMVVRQILAALGRGHRVRVEVLQ